jgi:hypothetical protein
LNVSGTKRRRHFRRADCSIADVSLTGHGKGCSAQIDACNGGTANVSAYMDHIESRLARDVKPV